MSTYTTDKASPFTRAVVSAMRRLYVLSYIVFVFRFAFGCVWVVGLKADDSVCLHLGTQRSWLIVVSIILGVSSTYGAFVGVYVMLADCRIFKCFLKRRLILSDGR